MPPTLKKPAPKRPRYIKWGEVVKLTQSVNLTFYDAKTLFRGEGSTARKFLRNKPHPVYVESVVLAALGIEV